MKVLKDERLVILAHIHLNILFVQKTDVSWRIMVGYHQLNQVGVLIVTGILSVISLILWIKTQGKPLKWTLSMRIFLLLAKFLKGFHHRIDSVVRYTNEL